MSFRLSLYTLHRLYLLCCSLLSLSLPTCEYDLYDIIQHIRNVLEILKSMSEQSEYCQGRNKLKLRVTICGFPPIHIYISVQQLRKAQESYPSFLWSN